MNNPMLKIAIILGSTRPGRNGEAVNQWVYEIAMKRSDADFELVDIKDFNLPLLDEPIPPSMGQYTKEHTKIWSAKIDSFDAYVFVTAEYNHGIPGALKNSIDFLYREWNNKVAGFVSYGEWCTCSGTVAFSYGRTEGCNRTFTSTTIAFYRF
jgi:NAD(P)H-dependent FMN reductase